MSLQVNIASELLVTFTELDDDQTAHARLDPFWLQMFHLFEDLQHSWVDWEKTCVVGVLLEKTWA